MYDPTRRACAVDGGRYDSRAVYAGKTFHPPVREIRCPKSAHKIEKKLAGLLAERYQGTAKQIADDHLDTIREVELYQRK